MNGKTGGTAYFLMNARRIDDLEDYRRECEAKQVKGRKYIVEKVVVLGRIDYENVSTDLLADREFISENSKLMYADGDVWHCILVRREDLEEYGMLINSMGFDYPKWTALYEKSKSLKLL